jgi:hypothetical protein
MPVPRRLKAWQPQACQPKTCQPKAVSVGGSVGGLLIGNMLPRPGWSVDIFERPTSGLESSCFIERGLAGPTSDPGLGLTCDFIIRESARFKPPRAASSKERVLQ